MTDHAATKTFVTASEHRAERDRLAALDLIGGHVSTMRRDTNPSPLLLAERQSMEADQQWLRNASAHNVAPQDLWQWIGYTIMVGTAPAPIAAVSYIRPDRSVVQVAVVSVETMHSTGRPYPREMSVGQFDQPVTVYGPPVPMAILSAGGRPRWSSTNHDDRRKMLAALWVTNRMRLDYGRDPITVSLLDVSRGRVADVAPHAVAVHILDDIGRFALDANTVQLWRDACGTGDLSAVVRALPRTGHVDELFWQLDRSDTSAGVSAERWGPEGLARVSPKYDNTGYTVARFRNQAVIESAVAPDVPSAIVAGVRMSSGTVDPIAVLAEIAATGARPVSPAATTWPFEADNPDLVVGELHIGNESDASSSDEGDQADDVDDNPTLVWIFDNGAMDTGDIDEMGRSIETASLSGYTLVRTYALDLADNRLVELDMPEFRSTPYDDDHYAWTTMTVALPGGVAVETTWRVDGAV